MAKQMDGIDVTFVAQTSISSSQYYFVTLVTSDKVDLARGGSSAILGVLQNDPERGQAAKVRILGHTKVMGGNNLVGQEGSLVGCTTYGTGLAAIVSLDNYTSYKVGILTKGAVSGAVSEMVITGAFSGATKV